MIVVSVMYPDAEGHKFDMAYYCAKHMPMVQLKLGPACKRVNVLQGLGGDRPGTKPTYSAIGPLWFDSVEAFEGAFGPHAAAILADIPNYTNSQPVIQINEVKM